MATQKLVINCTTGKEEYLDLTSDEIAAATAMAEAAEAERVAAEEAATKRAAAKASGDAKLKELGLTDEEIAAR